MKRYLVAAAVAVAVGLGTAEHAQAQISYTLPAYGGVLQSGNDLTPYGRDSFTNFYSPLTGYIGSSTQTFNTLYGRETYSSMYTPYTGLATQSRGIASTPFGPLNYSTYYSPYTGLLGEARFGNSSANSVNNAGVNNNFVGGYPNSYGNYGNGGYNNNGTYHHHHR
jgi:hypothetical protein